MSLAETRPNFLIIGAARAATTTLSHMLKAHPQANIVRGKEPHFFSYDEHYAHGWHRYQSLYSHCTSEVAIGDASTSYSRIRYHPHTVQRILSHVPDVRIIYSVRNPIERMESAYAYRLGSPGENQVFPSINHAVRQQPMILDSSRYWEVFDYYRRNFGESRIKIVWFEEFVADIDAVFSDICRFLEIDDTIHIRIPKEGQNRRDTVIGRMKQLGRGHLKADIRWDDETYRWTIDQLREDNCRFLGYFDKPSDYWGDLFTR
jgi:hypothetical protein